MPQYQLFTVIKRWYLKNIINKSPKILYKKLLKKFFIKKRAIKIKKVNYNIKKI